MSFFEDIREEAEDFFEDFFELLSRRETKKEPALEIATARPAFFFAERIENILAIVFGASILISAATATFLGFSTIGELLSTLITSWWGRLIMGIIGISYLMTAVWRMTHIKRDGV